MVRSAEQNSEDGLLVQGKKTMELFVGSDLDGSAVAAVRCAAAFPCKPAYPHRDEDS